MRSSNRIPEWDLDIASSYLSRSPSSSNGWICYLPRHQRKSESIWRILTFNSQWCEERSQSHPFTQCIHSFISNLIICNHHQVRKWRVWAWINSHSMFNDVRRGVNLIPSINAFTPSSPIWFAAITTKWGNDECEHGSTHIQCSMMWGEESTWSLHSMPSLLHLQSHSLQSPPNEEIMSVKHGSTHIQCSMMRGEESISFLHSMPSLLQLQSYSLQHQKWRISMTNGWMNEWTWRKAQAVQVPPCDGLIWYGMCDLCSYTSIPVTPRPLFVINPPK